MIVRGNRSSQGSEKTKEDKKNEPKKTFFIIMDAKQVHSTQQLNEAQEQWPKLIAVLSNDKTDDAA